MPIFVAALGASNYTYACATPGETQVDWLTALGQAFSYFGGVSEMVVPDNPRALIAHPDRYEPGLNRAAQECARHYDTVMLPARPRKPQDKAKAEVAVQIVERWIMARLGHQQFFSLHVLNQAIAELLEDLNQRPFKKLDGCRREWFERLDQPVLRPLPLHPYEVVTFKRCKVNIDYHIEVNGGFYSVPSALARQSVDVRLSAHSVEILHGNRRVASHLRLQRRGAYSTQSEHMPASHKAHREWTPQRLLDWGERIGPHARQIVEHQLTHKPHPEMGYRACLGLLSLARQYGNARLEAAASRAVQLRTLNGRTVRNLLKQGLDQQPLPKPATQAAPPSSHENVRGADYYTQEELFDDDPTHPEPVAPTAAQRHGRALEEQWTLPASHSLSFDERLGLLLDRELAWRDNKRLERLRKQAKLKYASACLEDLDRRRGRALDERLIATLAGGDWLRQRHNLLLTDPAGVGKTWLACTLGHQACRQGYSALYLRTPRLLEQLRIAHGDGSFGRTLQQLAKVEVLVLDDWGLAPLEENARHDLLEVIDDRAGTRSTILTSQLPVEHWHGWINDPTLADALLDRLVHNAYRIVMKGESLRRKNTEEEAAS